ncbi:VapA/VapB family virulence-associated protein [Xenorhabdus hominickii]|uniref:Uncharacterized protein n=1 Tax=Xenorhabdus hominickii TaxID=351679 RepID=A0A2G0QGM1_XENHO|nr:VapA/VapB family virulence-associated protein [Xenorhabdus hominickii]AOM42348.1 hypothetical protein A9255_18360 [Xenorhabdus hominickii]PHM58357.1 hypothetical protein Xhom_01379 [Xenorhabdus hominickii]
MKNQNNKDYSELNNHIKDNFNNRFFQDMKGRIIDPVLLKDPAEIILFATQEERVDASASIISEIIYFRLNVTIIDKDRTFNGRGWCLSSVGAGGFSGGVYSDDLTMLYLKAHNFWFYEAFTLIVISFYDNNSNYLGKFKGNGISTVNGVGSSTGIFY